MRHTNSPPVLRHALGSLLGKGLLVGLGLWAWSNFPRYWFLGAALAAFGGVSMVMPIYHIGVARQHRKQQRQWAYEAKEKIFGKTARLAKLGDDFINQLRGRSGLFIGALGKELLFYNPWAPKAGHLTCFGPARSGKSSTGVLGTLLNAGNLMRNGGLKFSIWVNDCKGELYHVTAAFLEWAGYRVLALNPFGVEGIRQNFFNYLEVVLDSVIHEDGEARDWCSIIAQALIPEPEGNKGGSSENTIFREGGRRLLIALILYLAVFDPFNCNLVKLRELVWASNQRLLAIANRMRESDKLRGLIKSYGEGLTNDVNPTNQKLFYSFKTEALGAVDIFDPSSDFANTLMRSDFKLYEILDEKTVLFQVLPQAKLNTHGAFSSLMSTLLMETVARQNKRSKLLMLFDEIGNLPRIPTSTLKKALSLLPGLGLRIATYWQSISQTKMYGDDIAKLILDQSSVLQAWSVRDPDMAKEFERRSGKTTVKKNSYSKDPLERDYNWRLNLDEKEEPVLSETELLQMSEDQQIVSISGHSMIVCRRVPFWKVALWRRCASPNPSEPGGYPKKDKVEWAY